MLDDDDDKVRRNLVVFSAAIIAVAVFELPIADMARALVNPRGVGDWQLKSTRAWWAALAVLAYLWLRFHFSPIGRESVKKMLEAQQVDLAARQSVYLGGVARAAMAGEPAYKALAEKIDELAQEHLGAAQGLHPHHKFEPVKRTLLHSTATNWQGVSAINFETISTNSPTPQAYNGPRNVPVPFTTTARWHLAAVAFERAWIWSETAIEYFVPLVLALIAVVVCIAKIVG